MKNPIYLWHRFRKRQDFKADLKRLAKLQGQQDLWFKYLEEMVNTILAKENSDCEGHY